MNLNTKIGTLIIALVLGPASVFANQIVCHTEDPNQNALIFSSSNPIPDYSFESFQIHSSTGAVFIHTKDFGTTGMTVRNAGNELSYEITFRNAKRQLIAYIHLSLHKSGIFNGSMLGGDAKTELLYCAFAD